MLPFQALNVNTVNALRAGPPPDPPPSATPVRCSIWVYVAHLVVEYHRHGMDARAVSAWDPVSMGRGKAKKPLARSGALASTISARSEQLHDPGAREHAERSL